MDKRSLTSTLLARGGFLSSRLPFPRNSLVVLNYHRVLADEARPEFGSEAVTARLSGFEAQIRWLSRNCDVPHPQEVLGKIEGGHEFGNPTVLVTFDDGYADNFEVAFPVLERHAVPAVFFVPTEAITRRRLGFRDRLAYLVRHSPRQRISLQYPAPLTLDLSGPDRDATIERVLELVKEFRSIDPEKMLDGLSAAASVDPPSPEVEGRELMTWDQLRALARSGMVVGGHGHTHRPLAALAEEEQKTELATSRKLLEEVIGERVELLSYPEGRPESFSDATKRLARETGHRAAFSFYGGINPGGEVDPFDVRRLAVMPNLDLNGFRALVRFPWLDRY